MRLHAIVMCLLLGLAGSALAQPAAERTLSSVEYVPGGAVDVWIKLTGDPGPVVITERPPEGWTIFAEDRGLIYSGGQISEGVITWDLASFPSRSRAVGYLVTPPLTATGDAVFSGKVDGAEITGMTTMVPFRFRFGTPTSLGPTVNSLRRVDEPSISADGLSLFFEARGLASQDLWVTTRETTDDEWDSPVNLGATVNSRVYRDGWPCISADGCSLFFASGRPGTWGDLDLWVTTRETTRDDWRPPVNLSPLFYPDFAPACPDLSADGSTLFYTARKGASNEIWQVEVQPVPTAVEQWALYE